MVEQQLGRRAARRGRRQQLLPRPGLAVHLRRVAGLEPLEEAFAERPRRGGETGHDKDDPDGHEAERGPGDQASEGGEHADSLPGVTDLFSAAQGDDEDPVAGGPGGGGAPLAVRMRPRTLDEVVGPAAPARPRARRCAGWSEGADAGRCRLVILWGPPGTGKTTLAHVVASATERRFVELSASPPASRTSARVDRRGPRARSACYRPRHGAVPRRDPPLHQGPAGRPAARRREPLGRPRRARPPRTRPSPSSPRCCRARCCYPPAADRRRRRAACSTGPSPTSAAWTARSAARRGAASTWCGWPAATPAAR